MHTRADHPHHTHSSRTLRYTMALIFLGIITMAFSFSYAEIRIDLEAVKTIESDGDSLAFNGRTKCYGLYQISEVCLKDYNQLNQTVYCPQDLFNPQLNEKIAAWYFKKLNLYLEHYGIPASITTLIAAYNWGIGNVVRWYANGAAYSALPQATQRYIERYHNLSEKPRLAANPS